MSWRPAAGIGVLKRRAELLAAIRAFFAGRGVMEVETPCLAAFPTPEPHIEAFEVEGRYLQSSPEFAMKRLLAAGSGPIYQISRAFRRGEVGRFHNPEFTLLEWYRPGFDHLALMREVDDLLQHTLALPPADDLTYREAFLEALDLDPLSCPTEDLAAAARALGLQGEGWGRDELLDVLMSHRVGPGLGWERPVFLYRYPASQAAYARRRGEVAERFELYIKGVEIANGFHEVTEAREQRKRFDEEQARRRALGREAVPVDERLLAALEAGLPPCAGVALGIDRLLMAALDLPTLHEAMAFPWERA